MVWWCLLAVWHLVVFPGLQGNVEIRTRAASLAQDSSAHREHGCTELSRTTSGESKGTGLLSVQMQCSLYSRVKQLQAGEVLSCYGTFPGANKNLKEGPSPKCTLFRLRVAFFLTAVIQQEKAYKFVFEFLALKLHGVRELSC